MSVLTRVVYPQAETNRVIENIKQLMQSLCGIKDTQRIAYVATAK